MHAPFAAGCPADCLVMVVGTFGHAHEPMASLPVVGTAALSIKVGTPWGDQQYWVGGWGSSAGKMCVLSG